MATHYAKHKTLRSILMYMSEPAHHFSQHLRSTSTKSSHTPKNYYKANYRIIQQVSTKEISRDSFWNKKRGLTFMANPHLFML